MEVKISVIIPVYNSEKYITQCIDSILSQSMKEIEIICVDDCSQDNSYEILKQYALLDKRVIVKRNSICRGAAISRNKGIEIARGRYIAYVDSDDYVLSSNMLKDLYYKALDMDLDILFFGYKESIHDCEGDIIFRWQKCYPKVVKGKDFFCQSIESNNVTATPWIAIYQNDFLKQSEVKFTENLINEDTLYFYEVLMKADRVSSIEDCYYMYIRRENSVSLSKENIQRNIWSMSYIIDRIVNYNMVEKDNRLKICENHYNKLWFDYISKNYEMIKFFDFEKYPLTPEVDRIIQFINTRYYNGYFPYKLPKDIVDRISKYNNIIIYGAGKVGNGLKALLEEYSIKIDGFAVTKTTKENAAGVCSLDEISDKEHSLILIAIKPFNANELIENTNKLGFKNVMNLSVYA